MLYRAVQTACRGGTTGASYYRMRIGRGALARVCTSFVRDGAGRVCEVRRTFREIGPDEYDTATRLRPEACPMFALGDRRSGRQLLADFAADNAAPLAALPGTASGRRFLAGLPAAVHALAAQLMTTAASASMSAAAAAASSAAASAGAAAVLAGMGGGGKPRTSPGPNYPGRGPFPPATPAITRALLLGPGRAEPEHSPLHGGGGRVRDLGDASGPAIPATRPDALAAPAPFWPAGCSAAALQPGNRDGACEGAYIVGLGGERAHGSAPSPPAACAADEPARAGPDRRGYGRRRRISAAAAVPGSGGCADWEGLAVANSSDSSEGPGGWAAHGRSAEAAATVAADAAAAAAAAAAASNGALAATALELAADAGAPWPGLAAAAAAAAGFGWEGWGMGGDSVLAGGPGGGPGDGCDDGGVLGADDPLASVRTPDSLPWGANEDLLGGPLREVCSEADDPLRALRSEADDPFRGLCAEPESDDPFRDLRSEADDPHRSQAFFFGID